MNRFGRGVEKYWHVWKKHKQSGLFIGFGMIHIGLQQ